MRQYLWQDRAEIDAQYVYPFHPRPECLSMLQRPPTAALDIGCGSGGVGHALRQRFPLCVLWGCEFDGAAANLARQHFDVVVEQDVETVDFKAMGLKKPFDLVCLFDVLEHLVNPWKLLNGLLRVISEDAQVLVSLPNVANLLLLHDALRGYWRYNNWGLLDFTHIRFFTDYDARKMFYQTGYRVLSHEVNFFGQAASIFEQYKSVTFPTLLTVGDITMKVHSQQDLRRLCADQNLYLISPHHGFMQSDSETDLASNNYPQTHAFGG